MRTEEFKQFQIVVNAHLDTARFGYWHATYQIMESGFRAEKLSGTIAAAFKSSEEAEAGRPRYSQALGQPARAGII